MEGVPLSSIAQISSKQLKPPQKIVYYSGIENKLPNRTEQNKTEQNKKQNKTKQKKYNLTTWDRLKVVGRNKQLEKAQVHQLGNA